jgi:hypothetical protein
MLLLCRRLKNLLHLVKNAVGEPFIVAIPGIFAKKLPAIRSR